MESNPNGQDFLPLLGTDYVEFYVGNAKQAAHYYKTAFGYQDFAYSGPETGDKEKVSYVLMQDKVRLILTTPLHPSSMIADHVHTHGDGVKAIALTVNDAYDAFEQTVKRGAKPYMQPKTTQDEQGEIKMSGIHIYGDTRQVSSRCLACHSCAHQEGSRRQRSRCRLPRGLGHWFGES